MDTILRNPWLGSARLHHCSYCVHALSTITPMRSAGNFFAALSRRLPRPHTSHPERRRHCVHHIGLRHPVCSQRLVRRIRCIARHRHLYFCVRWKRLFKGALVPIALSRCRRPQDSCLPPQLGAADCDLVVRRYGRRHSLPSRRR